MTRYYPQAQIDQLVARGQARRERDRNDNYPIILTINLPEPGGAVVREEIRALESVTLGELIANRTNPYLREMAKARGIA